MRGAVNAEPTPSGLDWRAKAGYGSVDLGLAAVESLVQIYLLKTYHLVVGLPPSLAGLALGLAILWDAVSDPVMGGVSDRTTAASGRRRPYFVPGAAALALSFVLLFNPPAGMGTAVAFAYLLSSFILVNTAMTVVAVPHAALGGELSRDRHQRTVIFGYKRLFGTVGALSGIAIPAALLAIVPLGSRLAPATGTPGLASALLAIPILLTAWIATRATRGRDRGRPSSGGSLLAMTTVWRLFVAQKQTLRNPFFRVLMLAFVVTAIGRTLSASTALYYYQYRLQLSEQQAILALLLPFFICFLLSIPAWVALSRRWGKKQPAAIGVVVLGLSGSIAYPLFPPGQLLGPVLYSVVGGFLAGAIILLDSLVADTIDYDRMVSRAHREGLYFGVWRVSTKAARALGLVLAGVLLEVVGFGSEAIGSSPTTLGLALIFGPAVGSMFAVSGLILACMPLTRDRHDRIQAVLTRRLRHALRAQHKEQTP
jgi:glycoside/pentoside/hexuronide:cation symporter, GPH family